MGKFLSLDITIFILVFGSIFSMSLMNAGRGRNIEKNKLAEFINRMGTGKLLVTRKIYPHRLAF